MINKTKTWSFGSGFAPELEERSCPLCGERGQAWKTINDWPVVKCCACGLVFVNPCPTEETMIRAYALPGQEYSEFFGSSDVATCKLMNEGSEYQRANSAQYLQFIERHRNGLKGVILDLGCSSGLFLEEAAKRGWATRGVDPGSWGVPEKDRELGIERCSLFHTRLPAESMDAVFTASVIEHLVDPLKYLVRLRELMKPEGVLYLAALPNIHSLSILLGFDKWIGNHPPLHLSYFCRKTAHTLLNRAGFDVIHTEIKGLSETILQALFFRNGPYDGSVTEVMQGASFKAVTIRMLRDISNKMLDLTGTGSVMDFVAVKRKVEGPL